MNLPSRFARIFLIFNALNLLLVAVCPKNAIPQRDVLVAVAAAAVLITIVLRNKYRYDVKLKETARFVTLLKILSSCEVLGTIVLPWVVLIRERLDGNGDKRVFYMLAPHLFVFQAQIALESIIMLMKRERADLLFWYTVVANCYRGLAIAQWIRQMLLFDQSDQISSFMLKVLPSIAMILYIFSNSFIGFVWYPLLDFGEPLKEKGG
jgi:hypothetical protein